MRGQGVVVVVLLLVVFLCALAAAFQVSTGTSVITDDTGIKVGNPEQFARATGVARAADLAREGTRQAMDGQATRAASSAQATATAAAVFMQATQTAIAQNAQATATAIPFQAALVENRVSNETVRTNVLTVALGTGVLVAALLALAIITLVRTRARLIPRGSDGQLPGVLIGGSVLDPSRQIGPAITAPGQWSVFARWTVECLVQRRWLPYPDPPRVELADGGADADHYLEAARVAGMVGVASAMFRPENERGRRAKLDIVRTGGSLAPGLGAPVPITRIAVTGDSAIQPIAEMLGARLPPGGAPVEHQP
jgi:hypothetical protein